MPDDSPPGCRLGSISEVKAGPLLLVVALLRIGFKSASRLLTPFPCPFFRDAPNSGSTRMGSVLST